MTFGILLPLALVLMAIVTTFSLLPAVRRLEAGDAGKPQEPDAAKRARTLKWLIAAEWLMPIAVYLYLNVFSDVGTFELF